MRFKSLLYLVMGVVTGCMAWACNQNPNSLGVAPSAANKKTDDSITLPVTVIFTSDAVETPTLNDSDYLKTLTVERFDTAATPMAVYGASKTLWLAPKGYTGQAATGADGSISVGLYPTGGSDEHPPFVRYQAIPACMGCMMMAAAPFFENAKADLLNNFDTALLDLVSIPNKLVIQKRSATLVTYTYTIGDTCEVTGLACYNPQSDSATADFESADFALGPGNKALTDLLVKRFICMRGLK